MDTFFVFSIFYPRYFLAPPVGGSQNGAERVLAAQRVRTLLRWKLFSLFYHIVLRMPLVRYDVSAPNKLQQHGLVLLRVRVVVYCCAFMK